MAVSVSGLPLTGWVPIRLIWRAGEPIVEWCYLGRERFTDPFFDSTIQRALETPFNRLFRHHTSMATLAEWARQSPGIPPSGFIFHMSRCGSTVVSQLLATLAGHVVVAEAGPIDSIARADLKAPSAILEQRIDWLQSIVSVLGQPRAGGETRYFVKFDARTTLELPLLRQAYPDVPWIFVYRDPVEVLVSLAASPNALTTPGMGENVLRIAAPFEEYAARVLGLLCREAARHFPSERGLLVNYTQLPDICWRELPDHFGFALEDGAREAMQQAAQLHAKDRKRRYEPDSARRQAEASGAIREAARQWAAPQYAALEHLRLYGRA
jgi:hypothetical protein